MLLVHPCADVMLRCYLDILVHRSYSGGSNRHQVVQPLCHYTHWLSGMISYYELRLHVDSSLNNHSQHDVFSAASVKLLMSLSLFFLFSLSLSSPSLSLYIYIPPLSLSVSLSLPLLSLSSSSSFSLYPSPLSLSLSVSLSLSIYIYPPLSLSLSLFLLIPSIPSSWNNLLTDWAGNSLAPTSTGNMPSILVAGFDKLHVLSNLTLVCGVYA